MSRRGVLKRVGLIGFAVGIGSALASCGGGSGARAPAATTHTVTLQAVGFKPQELTIALGDSIEWVNKDPFPHTATSESGGFDSKDIGPDKSWKYTPSRRGEFPYVCTLHPTMTGRVRVQ